MTGQTPEPTPTSVGEPVYQLDIQVIFTGRPALASGLSSAPETAQLESIVIEQIRRTITDAGYRVASMGRGAIRIDDGASR